jgi:TonB family protein
MPLRIILAAVVLSFLAPDFASAKTDSSAPLHTFYGIVKAVDLAARTITLKSGGKSFVFHITSEMKISGPQGYASLDKVQPGQGAAVVMRLGEGGIGIAVMIRFDPAAGTANYLALYSARTMHGEMISGIAFNNYVVYEPPLDAWSSGITYEVKHASMFVLSVRPDGTVSDARPIQGLGYPELDARAVKWLKKWRFRPNSVTEVRMPFGYSERRNY